MAESIGVLLAFTLVPLTTLVLGVGFAIAASVALRDRRILLGGLLFALMASHQVTEIMRYLAGGTPHQNVLGELFETAVNLLAVIAIVYLVGSLGGERRLTESLATVQGQLVGDPLGPSRKDTAETTGGSRDEDGSGALTHDGLASLPALFGHRSQVDATLRRAIDDARVTFPIATFDLEARTSADVVAETTYLREIFEIVLEQLVLYNDTSDPVVSARVVAENGYVAVRFEHNGSGLPEDVRTVLESGATGTDPELAELVFVETLTSKWGGDVSVEEDAAITVWLARPWLARVFE
ncbi:MAG: hypothetical protein ABEJ58_01055 [Halodesulfurarchaeum sp.]